MEIKYQQPPETGEGKCFNEKGDVTLQPILLPVTTITANNWTSKEVACSYSKTCKDCAGKEDCTSYGEHSFIEEETYSIINTIRKEITTSFMGVECKLERAEYTSLNLKGYNEANELNIRDHFHNLSCYIPIEATQGEGVFILVEPSSVMEWAQYTRNLVMLNAWGRLERVQFPKYL